MKILKSLDLGFEILNILSHYGEAFIVGGAVRDWILNSLRKMIQNVLIGNYAGDLIAVVFGFAFAPDPGS